jgi:hypothetical protein
MIRPTGAERQAAAAAPTPGFPYHSRMREAGATGAVAEWGVTAWT